MEPDCLIRKLINTNDCELIIRFIGPREQCKEIMDRVVRKCPAPINHEEIRSAKGNIKNTV